MTSLLPFLTYLLKMLSVSAVLLGYYYLFLRKTAAHTFNRFFLLGSVFLALQLPLVHIPFTYTDPVTETAIGLVHPGKIDFTPYRQQTPEQTLDAYQQHLVRQSWYVLDAYLLIALLFLWPLVRSLYLIRRLKKHYTPLRIADIYVYPTLEAGTPFSFFNRLFWNEEISTDTDKGKLIFRHELYHIRQLHSLDILTLESIRRLFWCNPFFFLMLRELKLVHEFLADRHAIGSGPDPNGNQRSMYAEWLVWQSQGLTGIPQLAHSFYHPQLQRRIAMLLHPAPQKAGRVTRWLSIPLMFVLLAAFAARGIGPVKERVPARNGPVMHSYRLSRFFLRNLRYPREALAKGMTGSVWIFMEMDASGHKIGGGGGTREMDTQDGKATALTITARALDARQRIGDPDDDRSKLVFVEEAEKVANLLITDSAVSVAPGSYYFSLNFKIERP